MLDKLKLKLLKIKAMSSNKFILLGSIFWLIGIAVAISVGIKALIAIFIMAVGNFLFDLAFEDDEKHGE